MHPGEDKKNLENYRDSQGTTSENGKDKKIQIATSEVQCQSTRQIPQTIHV